MKMIKQTLCAMMCCMSLESFALNKALLVGVGEYENPLANLYGIDKDIASAQQLVAHLGIDSKQVTLLENQQATVANFRQALQELAKTTKPDDKVLIYYSGHGSNIKDEDGDEDDGFDETLYLHDGHFIDDEFGELLAQIPSQNIVVLLDACHSGTGTRSLPPNSLTSNQPTMVRVKAWNMQKLAPGKADSSKSKGVGTLDAKAKNYIAIGAAQDHQQSLATPDGSLFTKALLTSFEQARSENKPVTWAKLYEETSQQLEQVFSELGNVQALSDEASFQPNMTGNQELAHQVIEMAAVPHDKPMWRETIDAAQKISIPLKIKVEPQLKQGDILNIEIEIPHKGHLNVVSIGPQDDATLLFPNKFAQNNLVEAQTLKIPQEGKFVIRAHPPSGEHLIAAFLTYDAIDLQKNALGNRDRKGNINQVVSRVPLASMRGLARLDKTQVTEVQKVSATEKVKQDVVEVNTAKPTDTETTPQKGYAAAYRVIKVVD